MTPELTDPPLVADEATMLDSWLDFHRTVLLRKCDGLGRDQLLIAACPPSELTLLGLLRHMSEVEQGWFGGFAGEPVSGLYYSDDDPDGDFHAPPDVDVEADLATFRAVCDHSRAVVAAIGSLDEARPHPEKKITFSLRWIMVHMIEEYARHNGHADLLREAVDGSTGD